MPHLAGYQSHRLLCETVKGQRQLTFSKIHKALLFRSIGYPSHYLHLTASTMTSSATTYSTLGDPKHGGALFTIPPEVRDEIYRLVVRKNYIVYITRPRSSRSLPSRDEHDFAILQVSKAISHEASDILYSESVFRFSMNFRSYEISCVPAHLANRMKNVELHFQDLWNLLSLFSSPRFHKNINAMCHAATADFASTEIKRNHLQIKFFACCPGMMAILSSHLSETLNALIGFRTVGVEVVSVCVYHLVRLRSKGVRKNFQDLQKEMIIHMGQQILDILRPTMGPVETAVLGDFPCFVLHPREFLASGAR